MKFFEVSGNDYQMGKQIGLYFKDYLNKTILEYMDKLKRDGVLAKVKYLENKLKDKYPKCLDEIYGRADGALIDRDATLLMLFPEIYKRIDGCTTLIMKNKDDKYLFSHNEDDVKYTKENVALIKYNYGNYWLIGYTVAQKLMGSSFGFNSYKLIFSSNYVYDTKIELDNISRYIIERTIMDCKNIDEAIEKLRKCEVASAFSLNILDLKENRAINVEKDIKDIFIKEIDDRYARANHFTSKKYDIESVPASSKFRDYKVNEEIAKLNKEDVKLDDIKNILAYRSDDYYKSVFKDPNIYNDLSVTVANFSYDGSINNIIIKDYLDSSTLSFDLNKM